MAKTSDLPKAIRPYASLGLRPDVRGDEALADCPFCGREGKLTINVETGQWRCFIPHGNQLHQQGNVYTFIRALWEIGGGQGGDLQAELARERGLLEPSTLQDWELVLNQITGEWLLPGYGVDGKINTLYRWTPDRQSQKMRLYATAELGHQLFGVNLYDEKKRTVYVCEGPWDAMALYEALRYTKKDVEGYSLTGAVGSSLYATANVLAVPSCDVFKEEWLPLFAGKKVVLCYDNDHARIHPKTQERVAPAAFEGMKRAAQMLASSAEHRPESIHWLAWGPEGFQEDLPSGYDLRDLLTSDPHPRDRVERLWWMLEKVEPIPPDWVGGRTPEAASSGGTTLSLLPCQEYKVIQAAFEEAWDHHEGVDRGLSIMLAIILSTEAGGDQLWGTFIGPPACGKSTLCEAISVAPRWVTAKSTIRGFHSGYKSDASGKEDNSLIPLIANKTLVTKDGDTLMTSPNLAQILAEARDLYDRTSRTHYRHGLTRNYEGVNVTWILCGTGGLSDLDVSELGQRFIKIVLMERIDEDQEWKILLRKAKQADRAMDHKSDGKPENVQDPAMTKAYQLTGGYVEYLRANATELLREVRLTDDVYAECANLARFVAYLRARPSKKQKERAEREFATRLTSQFTRLAKCLCVVMNTRRATPEVMRRVRQTALDTAEGRVLRLVRLIIEREEGLEIRSLAHLAGELEADLRELLLFMKRIGVVECYRPQLGPHLEGEPHWRLTARMMDLYRTVYEINDQTEHNRNAAAYEDPDRSTEDES